MDFILNGAGHGDIASRLLASDFDAGVLRPYIGNDGRSYVTANRGGKPVAVPAPTVNATLRKDEWIQLDTAVQGVAKERLGAYADLRSAGLTHSITNGMGKTVLEVQRVSDITPAKVSMDGLVDSDNDRVDFDLTGIPLPIFHKQFTIPARQLATSRNGGSPLDTIQSELATRRVAEEVEGACLGTSATYTYGGYTLSGYRTFGSRLTKTDVVTPGTANWIPATTLNDLLTMRQQSIDNNYFGPWNIYFSPAWSVFLDDDYSAAKGDKTLRERILAVEGFNSVRTADLLPAHDIIMVQMTSDVVRAVIGMDFTTIQWETKGGLALNFMVMAILVTQLRADQKSQTGIVHGTV